ncbi:MAG: type II toxin-antitoxin system Phd/YefM family antitoxin, partial [Desulfobacterales bacterium]|nr:type II toxin-antitoxin system Phd/YefM family antitoxin [Desulfobacterales bacterium]
FEEIKKKYSIIEDAIGTSSDPYILTKDGRPIAILQNLEGYRKMQRAIKMLQIVAMGESDIKKGNIRDHKDVFEDLHKKIDQKHD